MSRELIAFACLLHLSCTKDIGKDPALAYSDKALRDSCTNTHAYYKDPAQLIPSRGPHGVHKLRFNRRAMAALDSLGKLTVNAGMPEGAMIIKDIYTNNELTLYAYMYKRNAAWIWGEVRPDGEVLHSVTKNHSVCTGCHSGAKNDFIFSLQ